MDTFKLEPQPDEGDTNNSETLDHAVLDQQVLTQHNKFGFTNSTKKSANALLDKVANLLLMEARWRGWAGSSTDLHLSVPA